MGRPQRPTRRSSRRRSSRARPAAAASRSPRRCCTKVRALPGVAAAAGEVAPQQQTNVADILGRDGQPAARQSIGRGFDPATRQLGREQLGAYGPLELARGDWPNGPGRSSSTATPQPHSATGSATRSASRRSGSAHTFSSAGTVKFAGEDLPPRPSVAVWDVETAQALLGRAGRYDLIVDRRQARHVRGRARARRSSRCCPRTCRSKTRPVGRRGRERLEGHDVARSGRFLLSFGGIALLVGAFVIFNALSITVAQRTRELATLRTLGASRRQVMRSVLLEGIVLGVWPRPSASSSATASRRACSCSSRRWASSCPKGPTVFAARTVVVVAAPGHRDHAARQHAAGPPGDTRAADRRGPRGRDTAADQARRAVAQRGYRRHRCLGDRDLAGCLCPVASGALMGLLIAAGVLGLFAGIALLAPRSSSRSTRWSAGRRAASAASAGELAAANAVRNPGRTASTAATLMIGLTLVTVVAVLGASMNTATRESITDQIHAGYVVAAKDGPAVPRRGGRQAGRGGRRHGRLPRPLGEGARPGRRAGISGIDPATIGHFYRFAWSPAPLGRSRSSATTARSSRSASPRPTTSTVGGPLAVTTPAGKKGTLVVRGIYDRPPPRRCSATSASAGRRSTRRSAPGEQPHVPRRGRQSGARR